MDRIDPIIQVLAETSFPHQLFQVHVGRADEPDIHRNRLAATDPHHAAVLDGSQEFRLQMQRDVADFVQEERPAVGLLELAHMVRMRIGERALHMTEEFALEQGFRNGAGIDRHHGLSAPETAGMDFPRQDILAGSVLAGDEHRRVGRGDLVQGPADGGHGPGGAPEHRFLRFARNDRCLRFPGLVPGGGEDFDEFVVVPRFHDEIEGPTLHSLHRQRDIGIGREQDDLHLRHHLLDFPGPVKPFIAGVDAGGEIHVQQDHVRPELFQRSHQGSRRRNRFHRLEVHGQQDLQRPADAGVVVHDEYLSFPCSHNSGQKYTFSCVPANRNNSSSAELFVYLSDSPKTKTKICTTTIN